MMKPLRVFAAVAMFVAAMAVPGSGAPGGSADQAAQLRDRMNHHHMAEARDASSDPQPPSAQGLQQVGFSNLGGRGFNSDVWALKNRAYVGTWGVFQVACPNDGTKVVDISDPSNPSMIAKLPAPPGTQTNDVKVASIATPQFTGDIAVVSNEDCTDQGGARGWELWNVTNRPRFLSRFGPTFALDEEPFLSDIGFGVHNNFIYQQSGRVYVFSVVDFAEIFQFLAGTPRSQMVGDLRIFDITDPRRPVQIADWGAIKNLGLDPFETGQGDDPFSFLHDVWVEDGLAYLSWWDAGLIILDVTDPANPRFQGRLPYPPDQEGNTHVAVPTRGGALTVIGDEDFVPNPWGFGRVADTADTRNMRLVGMFATPNTLNAPPPDGDFSIHNVITEGDLVYASWYSDGIRIWDIRRPSRPREIAHFVPPAFPDPHGVQPTAAELWGVYKQGDLIFGSDMNAGLYILRRTG